MSQGVAKTDGQVEGNNRSVYEEGLTISESFREDLTEKYSK
jgi:hypothetical protein